MKFRMQRLLTAGRAKEIDRRAQDEFGISTLVLMENAGRAVAEEITKSVNKKDKVGFFCGRGNNGGDGFVAARHLLTKGIKPEVFLAGYVNQVQAEARMNLDILLKMKQKIIEVEEENLAVIKDKILRYNLVIDALLGVGLKGEVRGILRDLIGIINSSKATVLSVDIPSGLDATTGKILGCCINADKTVTFVAKKRGMVMGEGPRVCGRVLVRNLGITF